MPTNSMFDIDERPSDSRLVEAVWRSSSGSSPGSFTSTANSRWELVVTRQRGRTWISVRGPETIATPAPIPEEAEFLGITFKHGSFMPDLPAGTLVDAPIDLPGVSERAFRLMGSAWQYPDFENADSFVARLVREGLLVTDDVVQDTLQGRLHDLSPRSIQRRFLRATGLTQGTLYQIDRAQEAVRLLEQGIPILDTTDQTGYADQSHLTRALRRFWGYTPAQILRGETFAS
jgi:AraC-like DNA-binding protein